MANALETHLKSKGPLTMAVVQAYILQRTKHGYDKDFNTYLRSHFSKKKPAQRYDAFIDLFPEKFTRGLTVELAKEQIPDTPPPPRVDGLPGPAPYQKDGWRHVGVTSELAA
jgi:hypothetical protein